MPSATKDRRRPGVFENTAVNVVGLTIAHGLSALGGLITARVLGATGVGVLAVSFGLVEFGRALSNFTHMPSILAYHRGSSAEAVFGSSLTLKMMGTVLFMGLMTLLSPMLATTFNVPAWSVILASAGLVLGAFYEIGSAKFEADNRMVRRNVFLSAGPAVGFIALVWLALTGHLTILTSMLTTIGAVVIMSAGFVLDEPALYRFRFDKPVGKFLVTYGSRIVLTTILTMGLLYTDTLMVSYLLGNEAAGIYNVVFQITYVMVTASTAIGIALMPALSELHGRGEDTRQGFQRGTLISLAMSALLAVTFVLIGPLILRLYGAEFAAGYSPMLILLFFGVAAAVAVPAASLLTVHGHAGWLTGISLTQMVVNVPLNYFLIQRMGLLGAATATTTVFALGTLVTWWLIRRELGAWPLSQSVIVESVRTGHARVRGWLQRR